MEGVDFEILHFFNGKNVILSLCVWQRVLLTAVLLTCLAVGTFSKLVIYWDIQKTALWDKPINLLILTDQVLSQVNHVWLTVTFLIMLLIGQTYEDIFGPHYGRGLCWVLHWTNVYYLLYQTVGGFFIALYRILYMKGNLKVKTLIGTKSFLLTIHIGGLLTCGLFLYILILTAPRVYTFCACMGISETMFEVIGPSIMGHNLYQTFYRYRGFLVLLPILLLIELFIYVFLYHNLWTENRHRSRIGVLSRAVLMARRTRNAINLAGHVCTFAERILFLTVLTLMLETKVMSSQINDLVIPLKNVEFTVISSVQVLTSETLRRSAMAVLRF